MNASARKPGVLVIALASGSPLVADTKTWPSAAAASTVAISTPARRSARTLLLWQASAWYCLQTTW